MEAYIPYLVIVAVVIIFFGICYALFSSSSDGVKKKRAVSSHHEEVPKMKNYGSTYYSNINRDELVKEKQLKEKSLKEKSLKEEPITGASSSYESHYVKNPYEAALNDEYSSVTHSVTVNHSVTTNDSVERGGLDYSGEVRNGVDHSSTVAVASTSNSIEHTAVIPTVRAHIEETQMIPPVEAPVEMDEDGNETLGMTQKMPALSEETEGERNLSALEETRLINVEDVRAQLAVEGEVGRDSKKTASPWTAEAQEQEMVNKAINPFLRSFGVVGEVTRTQVEEITRHALQALHITTTADVMILLENIVVQEAVLCMQKAYAANPTEWMHAAALEAFLDVVQQPKSSTPYLVAFDALRILPHMTLGHFQIMALSLLLQYSRNSNNYSMHGLKHYVEKYIEPFVSELPRDGSFYRQLEYLRCTIQEREPITLAQLLSNSYPFVFNYRGFTREELQRVMGDVFLDSRFIVKSINSSLCKLALVDESMGPRFFRQARISDPTVQKDLLGLMCSKPTAFAGVEARNIMDDISPVLLDLADVFDNGPMASMSLTLLGLYIGRTHVKATIGEEFDLSRWF